MRLTFLLFCAILSFNVFGNDDFVIRSFDVSIEVLDDGSFQVEEKINVFFNERRRGIFRDIPLKYRVNGESKKLKLENVSVDNFKFKTKRSGGKYSIRIGDKKIYITGEQEYVIKYKVNNGLLHHKDFLEFYWNLTGNEWEVPIESSSFKVSFPSSVRLSENDIQAYSGVYGNRSSNIKWEIDGSTVIGRSLKILNPKEGISIATKLSLDDFNIPAPLPNDFGSRLSRTLKKEKLFALPFLLLGLLITWFRSKGRRKYGEIKNQYYPPEDFTPTEVGFFYDHHIHDRDLMALIPKWGHEGIIAMEVIGHSSDDHEVYFHKTGELKSIAPSYEQTFFDGIFQQSGVIKLEDLKGVFYKIFAKSRNEFSKNHQAEHLYDQQAKTTFHSPWYHLVWALLIGLGIFSIIQTYVLTGIGIIALSIVGFIITLSRPRLSDRGFNIHHHLKGLKQFLKNPEEKELMRVCKDDPHYLDKILPYVVAFGLDRSWEGRIRNIRSSDPEWYYGAGMQSTSEKRIGFSEGFNVREIKSAFIHNPNSGGSNSSSGGFSGGGVGGGGGGSW